MKNVHTFIHHLVAWKLKRRIKTIEQYKTNTVFATDLQEQTLLDLVQQATPTLFGKQYQFSKISTLKDFKEQVPLQDYEKLKTYTGKIFDGKSDVLWPGKVEWFAQSSGTTNDKSKYIPLTKASLRIGNYQAGSDIMAYYCQNNSEARPFMGKGIVLGGSHKISQLNSDIRCGDLSSVLIHTLPPLARYLTGINLEISIMDDWSQKLEALSDYYLPKNVTSISGVPSWVLVFIKHVLEKTGKEHIEEVWPNFEVFFHGGISFEPYQTQFNKVMPTAKFVETYNASEGFFAFQDEATNTGLLLLLDYGVFYEFLPLAELDKEHPQTLQLSEVVLGEKYALVITTNAGLWRYLIGDVIEFCNLAPYRIRVAGRTKHFINVFGEEVMVANTDKALAASCKKHQARVTDYTVAPVFMGDNKGRHEWLIEFEQIPKDINAFAQYLDQTLQSLNSDYEAKRSNDFVLESLKITVAPIGNFHSWLERQGKLGGQHKVPRLCNSRVFLEEILCL